MYTKTSLNQDDILFEGKHLKYCEILLLHVFEPVSKTYVFSQLPVSHLPALLSSQEVHPSAQAETPKTNSHNIKDTFTHTVHNIGQYVLLAERLGFGH